MAKREPKPSGQHPFDPEVLSRYARPAIRPMIGGGAVVWRFTVVVPIEEIQPQQRKVATADDLDSLEGMFTSHFGGLTVLPKMTGYGPRDPKKPGQEPQMNVNVCYVVYAAAVRASEKYFRRLQREIQDALGEGLVLIERQDVVLV